MPAAAIPLGGAILGAAGITAVAGLGGTALGASAQKKAAQTASNTQLQMQAQTRADLAPFRSAGVDATNQLMSRMGEFTSPFSMTQAQLEATPGYQFDLSQGLKSTNNALGARGLLNSGAVMKGAASYATGLADNTYMNQFNMDQTQKTNNYNRLLQASQLGENAAAQTGAYGTQAASQVGQNTIGAGNAAAAAYMGGANAIGTAASSVPQALLANRLLSGIYGNSGGSAGLPNYNIDPNYAPASVQAVGSY